ncbi:hypothetical protein M501DRAFT_1015746 [Patellaria atrata CBS 101060]|uniref:Linoleate diol synthase n=1 Tax=Patellaria atrata CBS 101060 TaxID=1346257 RepID=A0A9P4VNF0_9PEZI|nr:hypothetical protein M501DRAFT_1015746 [Patellaria atrata CBS 101060]
MPSMEESAPPKAASRFELENLREKIDAPFKQLAALITSARRPLPTESGDGTELDKTDLSPTLLQKLETTFKDMSHLGISDFHSLIEVQKKKISGEHTNDKTYLMEGLIRAACALPVESKMSKKITGGFLTQLWNDLQHPPQSILGDKYTYRSADGSFNSLVHPQLGAANMPYARSVKPATMLPGALPDPSVIFDSIMERKVHEKHPNRISSVLFYLASIIIHDAFRTSHEDFRISKTSSYLDLSPLYGSNATEQKEVRTFKDGKLKPDTFSEKRLFGFPPGVSVLLVMFNRFHNYIVENLALINQGGQFSKPSESKPGRPLKTWEQYDEELFQTGRLITCGLYINIILIDYVRTILNLNRCDSDWALDPRLNVPGGPPMGTGNQVAAEFNLVYRWHSTISDRDEEWTNNLFKSMFPGRAPKEVPMPEFLEKLKTLDDKLDADPGKRVFAGLKRGPDGRFNDDDLVKELTASIEDCANSFGAQRVPTAMRAIEILGMHQARAWNVASLNEFRKHFGLTPHQTFESINPDKYVADQLRHLYDTPDHVELYPGLVCESAKDPMAPGAGLTPGYTISRGVLSDAVGLVRGDRFYTIDYHPRKLTNWGYTEVDTDKSIDNGCVFYKLILRAFPNHFKPNSVYAHYPLTVPSEMETVLKDLGKHHLYNYEEPKAQGHQHVVLTAKAVKSTLENQETFKVPWTEAILYLMGESAKNFSLAGDLPANTASRNLVGKALYTTKWDREVKEFYEHVTLKLLKQKSYKLAGVNQIDIIRDVGNLAHVHFSSEMFSLPLKTDEHPLGIFTEHEMYLIMSAIFICIFFDIDPAKSFPLRQKALKATQTLGKIVEANVKEVRAGGMFSSIMQVIYPHNTPLKSYGIHMIQRLLDNGTDIEELVWSHIMGTAGGMVANQGQLFGQLIEYFLTEGKEHLPEIQRLAKLDTDDADQVLMKYMLEGSRLAGETGVFRTAARDVDIEDGERTLRVKKGDKLLVNLRAASHDPEAYPNPSKLDLDRPVESYLHLGHGPHKCLGVPMTRVALTTMLKTIGRLDGLRPAVGPQGRVHKISKPLHGVDVGEEMLYHAYLTEAHDMLFPFPCSMKVNWDGDLE